mgnify:FL=1
MATPRAVLSAPQRSVLTALKRLGEATADELAAALQISPSAVRQHLGKLRSAGLVAARQERGRPGRPTDHYRATDLSEPLYATAESDLAIELLDHIREEDPALVDRVFDRRRRRLARDVGEKLPDSSIADRIEGLTRLLDSQGYLADIEHTGGGRYRLNLRSCAMWDVANRYRQACNSELDLLRDLIPGARVRRVAHKTSGAHTCVYEIDLPD